MREESHTLKEGSCTWLRSFLHIRKALFVMKEEVEKNVVDTDEKVGLKKRRSCTQRKVRTLGGRGHAPGRRGRVHGRDHHKRIEGPHT